MFKNHLKIAQRSILKDKMFTFIKIGGFAVGIMACVLIALFIKDELSYDKHYVHEKQIYRVYTEVIHKGELIKWTHYPAPFAKALKEDFPEIQKSGRFLTSELFGTGNKELRIEGESENIFENGFIFADQELLEILEIPLAQGSTKSALSQPGTIVISQAKADKYFPNGDAIGKTLILDNNTEKPYKITGVMKDSPENTHFEYNFLMTMVGRGFYPYEKHNWGAQNYHTYILVNDNTNIQELEQKMFSIVEDYMIPTARESNRLDKVDFLKSYKFKLQPVSDIHLKSIDISDGLKHGDIRFVWLFGAIAVFILLLACVNFINLSTAKSANRAKEVGLRKTVGAFRSNLITQFITESVLFSIVSFVLGVLLAWVLLPYFNTIASKALVVPWGQWWFLPILLLSALCIGILAGLYPAFYLSAFKPVSVLKGSLSTGSKSGKLRSGLVIFQFTTSIILIIGTLIIYQQVNYILNKKLGYDKEQVLIVQGTKSLGNKTQNFKDRLLKLSEVKQVSVSDYLPIEGTKRNGNTFKEKGKENDGIAVPSQIWEVDHDYINTLDIRIKKGRDFSRELASDSTDAIVINEIMARDFGFENPLGKEITNGRQSWTVIGVVEDFHFETLKDDIQPLAMTISNSPGMISVRLGTDNINQVLKSITSIWDESVPNQSFRYSFLNQDFSKMHEDVQRMGKIFISFALFAILVACLGLFALSAFMVEQRKKEISIRLVLGAPFKSIYKLLTLDFLKLIIISIAIAIPIGWYMMSRWLEDFAYRINIGWGIFLVAGTLAIAVAILTISYQSIGAAFIKPLKSLRTE
ncbi:ABC transporter permease [Aquimarina macrocephali]|uniref:ABC transporter permease n=1 Tax=Aquimarina macrocephali TaxID=666563 RepID=UPI00046754E5|nr:ABC transporter permease [Aquimarina macrocephali]